MTRDAASLVLGEVIYATVSEFFEYFETQKGDTFEGHRLASTQEPGLDFGKI